MGGKAVKDARRINCLDIQEQLEYYNEYGEYKIDDNDLIEDDIVENNSEPTTKLYNLYDLISNSPSTKKKTSKKERKHLTPEINIRYQVTTSSEKMEVAPEEENRLPTTCFDGHDLSEESRYYLKNLQSTNPHIYFSHLGKDLRGSAKILCFEFKVAFFLIWNVDECNFDLQIIPVVNCSRFDNKSLVLASKNIAKKLTGQFDKHINMYEHKETIFCSLSRFLVCHHADITMQLSKELGVLSESNQANLSLLENLLKKSNIAVEHSLDYFDFFALSNEDYGPIKEKLGQSETAYENDVCPICFDTYEDNDIQLMTCGHKACKSCWKDLVRASSSSGDVCIRCPAYKCEQMLTMRDVCHILFDKVKDVSSKDMTVLMNLMRFKMDNALLDKQVQHCSTPSCNRIFSTEFCNNNETNKIHSAKNMKICLCSCGASICGDCHAPSHFGISCESSKRIRKEIDTGRIGAELQSLLWLQNNTSPCPRCKFPINKNGGCNHVRCSKCDYYFCWVCGGDGANCGAYVCKRTGVVTFGKEDEVLSYDSEDHMTNQIMSIINYSTAVSDLNDFFKRNGVGTPSNKQRECELRIRTMLTWLRGFTLANTLFDSPKYRQYNILDAVNSLELALSKLNETPDTSKIELIIKSEQAITRPVHRHYTQNEKRLTKPLKKQMKFQNEIDQNEVSLKEILDVTKMHSMNDKQFNTYVSYSLNTAMVYLTSSRRKKKKHIDESEMYKTCPLNKRMKPLKAPWKGESRFDDSPIIVQEASTYQRTKKCVRESNLKPWKGKHRIFERRKIALSQRERSWT